VFTRFGFPNELVSDNGPAFAAKITKAWKETNGIKEILITPYNPRANGLVERWNSTVIQMLRFYVNHRHDDWDTYLPYVTFAFNTADNPTTKCSPFFLFYGREPQLPLRIQVSKENEKSLTQYNRDLIRRVEKGREILLKTKEELKRKAENYLGKVIPKIKPGDYIMVKKFTNAPDTSKKLEDKFEGPYLILERSGLNNFVIKKEGTKETIHTSHIKPYQGRTPATPNFSANLESIYDWEEEEPDLQMDPERLIGKYVLVYWNRFKNWYAGLVIGRKGKRHLVKYIDQPEDAPEDEEEIYPEKLLGYKHPVKWKLLCKPDEDVRNQEGEVVSV